MSSIKKNFFLPLVLILLVSCLSKTPLQILSAQEGSLKTRGGYDSYLVLEYLDFARNLYSVKDKKNAQYFAQKGLNLLKDGNIIPENPLKWKADPVQIEEMVLMQKRLEMVLDSPHMTFYLPIQLAHLTYLYDCWISRESKAVFRADELAQCRTRFNKLLDEIEHYIDDLKKDKQPKVEITEPEFKSFEIIFDLNSFKFNDKANKDTVEILKYLKSQKDGYRILLVGNADRTGLELYNQTMALKRAETVKNYLIKNGVSKDLIELRSMGEDFPDVITKDGTQKQANRTVGIYVLKGFNSFTALPLPLIQNYVYREAIKKERVKRGLDDS
jgi:outer membrane protein OmpA-like peptidoglycan-associated protein